VKSYDSRIATKFKMTVLEGAILLSVNALKAIKLSPEGVWYALPDWGVAQLR
jgi:hypothetical protein